MTKEAFARRRNVWFALTIVAFVSPSFWIYAIVALVVLAWAAARDENPLALFAITLFVIPNVSFYIPTILVNNLFDLTQFRILSLAIVVPAIFRPQFGRDPPQSRFRREDAVLAAFLLLQVVLIDALSERDGDDEEDATALHRHLRAFLLCSAGWGPASD